MPPLPANYNGQLLQLVKRYKGRGGKHILIGDAMQLHPCYEHPKVAAASVGEHEDTEACMQ